jgi:hypothetical protein
VGRELPDAQPDGTFREVSASGCGPVGSGPCRAARLLGLGRASRAPAPRSSGSEATVTDRYGCAPAPPPRDSLPVRGPKASALAGGRRTRAPPGCRGAAARASRPSGASASRGRSSRARRGAGTRCTGLVPGGASRFAPGAAGRRPRRGRGRCAPVQVGGARSVYGSCPVADGRSGARKRPSRRSAPAECPGSVASDRFGGRSGGPGGGPLAGPPGSARRAHRTRPGCDPSLPRRFRFIRHPRGAPPREACRRRRATPLGGARLATSRRTASGPGADGPDGSPEPWGARVDLRVGAGRRGMDGHRLATRPAPRAP